MSRQQLSTNKLVPHQISLFYWHVRGFHFVCMSNELYIDTNYVWIVCSQPQNLCFKTLILSSPTFVSQFPEANYTFPVFLCKTHDIFTCFACLSYDLSETSYKIKKKTRERKISEEEGKFQLPLLKTIWRYDIINLDAKTYTKKTKHVFLIKYLK